MKKDGPSFQLYAADFYVDTNEWTCEEVGVYVRLLMSEWVNGDLPNNLTKLARIAGFDQKKFQKVAPQVLKKFQVNGNERLINLRLEETRLEQRKHREKQALRASSGWKKRNAAAEPVADAVAHDDDMPDGMPDGCSSSSSSLLPKGNSITSSKQEIKEIIDYLNRQSGKNFSHKTKATISHINARLAEKRTIEDFKQVIDTKCAKWLNDSRMRDFVRPETLFGTKFESYLNESVTHKEQASELDVFMME